VVSLGEGLTPLLHPVVYGDAIGLRGLHLKLDSLNPTGSFKDRGTTVSVSKLKEWGVDRALDDSSGNAGSSLAAYCAAAGIGCRLYVPSAASSQKIRQAEAYGAEIIRVPGSRSDVERSARKAWKNGKIYYASHALSPYFIDGTKTVAFEIADELGKNLPDHMVFTVGGGSLLLGAWKGFRELLEVGLIDRIPKLHCIQSESCMPVVVAFRKGMSRVKKVPERETVAAGIRISKPARGDEILEVIRRTGGSAEAVADSEILNQQRLMATKSGIFAEPTSCAALAGLVRLREKGKIEADDAAVVPITGSGFKDPGTKPLPVHMERADSEL